MRNRLVSALAILRVVPLGRFLLFALFHVLTSPPLRERLFVRNVYSRKLIDITTDLMEYRSSDLVSVVLPVNNGRSKGVERLVASLKAQTHPNIECIAVDSGSTDDTVAYLQGEGWTVIQIAPHDFTHAYSRNTGA